MSEPDRLPGIFDELREQEAQRAPSFTALTARAGRPRERHVGRVLLLMAAALAVLILWPRKTDSPETIPVVALSTWRPMTDVLLQTDLNDWLSALPDLGASVVEVAPPNFRPEDLR